MPDSDCLLHFICVCIDNYGWSECFFSHSFYVNSGVSKTIALIIFKFHRSYKLLNVLEFNSARKRMSVIIRDEEGKVLLLCKGADRYVNCDHTIFMQVLTSTLWQCIIIVISLQRHV